MIHKPCRLLRDAEVAGHLIGTDAVLAIGNHPDCSEPLVQAKRAILENSAYLRRELPPGVLPL